MTDDTLTFDATVQKVQTLVDHGLRVTLDLPEQAIDAAAVLMMLKREGVVLLVTVERGIRYPRNAVDGVVGSYTAK